MLEPGGFSIRSASRHYGVSRDVLARAVGRGELPAAKLSRNRFLILRSDFESWCRRLAVRPAERAEAEIPASGAP